MYNINNTEHPYRMIRLSCGDDIIAEVAEVETDEDYYLVISNPMKVMYMIDPEQGMVSINFMPWILPSVSITTDFTIYPKDILTVSDLPDHTIDNYLRMVELVQETIRRFNSDDDMATSNVNSDTFGHEMGKVTFH